MSISQLTSFWVDRGFIDIKSFHQRIINFSSALRQNGVQHDDCRASPYRLRVTNTISLKLLSLSHESQNFVGNLHMVKGNTDKWSCYVYIHKCESNSTRLWHLRFGHMSERGLAKLLGGIKTCKLYFCEECWRGSCYYSSLYIVLYLDLYLF